MDINSFNALLNSPVFTATLLVVSVWSLVWKGFALWRAGRNSQRNWFIAMLILNTAGILEIVYIFYFSKPKQSAENK